MSNIFEMDDPVRKVVYKYEIVDHGKNRLRLPVDAQILKLDKQNDKLYVWAIHDDKPVAYTTVDFFAVYTGEVMLMNESLAYVGSVVDFTGAMIVVHVFRSMN